MGNDISKAGKGVLDIGKDTIGKATDLGEDIGSGDFKSIPGDLMDLNPLGGGGGLLDGLGILTKPIASIGKSIYHIASEVGEGFEDIIGLLIKFLNFLMTVLDHAIDLIQIGVKGGELALVVMPAVLIATYMDDLLKKYIDESL